MRLRSFLLEERDQLAQQRYCLLGLATDQRAPRDPRTHAGRYFFVGIREPARELLVRVGGLGDATEIHEQRRGTLEIDRGSQRFSASKRLLERDRAMRRYKGRRQLAGKCLHVGERTERGDITAGAPASAALEQGKKLVHALLRASRRPDRARGMARLHRACVRAAGRTHEYTATPPATPACRCAPRAPRVLASLPLRVWSP